MHDRLDDEITSVEQDPQWRWLGHNVRQNTHTILGGTNGGTVDARLLVYCLYIHLIDEMFYVLSRCLRV